MIAHDNPDNAKNLTITLGVIALQVVVGIVLGTLLMVICKKIEFTGMPNFLAYLIGLATWAMVLFGTNTYKLFFIIIEPNWAAVLRNQRMSDVIPVSGSTGTDTGGRDPRTTLQDLKSLREIGSGISGKLPWEVPVATINTRSEVIIGTTDGKPFKCVTGDGAEVDVRWQVILTPLRGCLKKLVRKGETATQAFFKGRCEQIIRSWVAKIDEAEIRTKDEEFKKYFEEQSFEGENKISAEEAENGVFTNSPQILGFDRSAEFQKAKEAEVVAGSVAETIRKLKEILGEADPNLLLITATTLTGRSPDGVLLVPGMAGDPKALLAIKTLMDELKKGKGGK